ncbi:MAG: hypothetical protein V2I65_11865 [Paracoccaceae bacterium]|jgi:hypothetical protein|nr:hypothetical protein [Paracoccaceae bacterium]
MMHRFWLIPLALATLAACGPGGGGADRVRATEAAVPASGSPAERACLRDVAARTDNAVVRVQETRARAAGTEVIVLVGADTGIYPPAPWRCVAAADGSTSGIAFIGGA